MKNAHSKEKKKANNFPEELGGASGRTDSSVNSSSVPLCHHNTS